MTRITIHEDEGYCSMCDKVYKLSKAYYVLSKLGFQMALCPVHRKQLRRNYRNKTRKDEE